MILVDELKGYKVIISKSNKHPYYGYPFGHVFCRNIEYAQNYIAESEFKDLYIQDYQDYIESIINPNQLEKNE
ncbi:MAG TPA: hypothetical protein VJ599_00870 [Nitrososphaeraceae archaeon]|nr:hypothetical protein [Nitrososphaeraceae archaeon]